MRREKQWDEAIGLYQKVLKIDHKNRYALSGLGDAYRGKEMRKEAIETWERLLEVSPNNIYIMNRIGDALRREGEFDEALGYYEQILGKDSFDKHALIGKYTIYLRLGKDDKIKEIEENLMQHDPKLINILMTRVGDILRLEGKFEEAKKYYMDVLSRDKDDSFALLGIEKLENSTEEASLKAQGSQT